MLNQPLVSILIPARNEEKNIERCLKSILKQDYRNTEIIVLNDNSTDRTGEIVKKLAEKDSRIRLVSGKPLPQGWLGKNFACFQLSRYAKGDYLIFTDADTYHFNSSVKSSLACLIENKIDAACPFPRQIMVSLSERMAIPFINFAILLFMPLALIKKSKNPLFCTGVGQYFIFKREAYFGMGGHAAVKGKILEDVHISKKTKEAGFKYMIFDGSTTLTCRMYKNFHEVWKGYSRFMFSAFDYNFISMAIVLTLVTIFLFMPFLFLPLGIFIYNWSSSIMVLIILQVSIISTIRLCISLRFKENPLNLLLHPLSMIFIVLVSMNSFIQSKLGSGISWKGRTYQAQSSSNDLDFFEEDVEEFKFKNH
ncbi:MAG: glycosyltransferase [Actinomycetota bacterium]|nr:glycosyltransferase [Actinomycetota bacterium]